MSKLEKSLNNIYLYIIIIIYIYYYVYNVYICRYIYNVYIVYISERSLNILCTQNISIIINITNNLFSKYQTFYSSNIFIKRIGIGTHGSRG